MRQSPFIWLGSGRSRKRGVADKGKMLDLAARGGLPVPQGGILLDEFYRICLSEGICELVGDKVVIPDPLWFYEVLFQDIHFPLLKGKVAVRLAAAGRTQNRLLQNSAQLNIDFDSPQQLAAALRKVWSAADPRREDQQMDVLVMVMVATQTSGIAISHQENPDDQMHITTSEGDVPNGPGNSLILPRLRVFQRSSLELPPYARRMQKLLAGVRRTFGRGDYSIEWSDDGEICWLLQIL